MSRISPSAVLLILLLVGGGAGVFLSQTAVQTPAPGQNSALTPTAALVVAQTPKETEDLRKQITIMEGQIEYLQGQVSALQEENAQLIQKLGSLGMKGVPKMEPPLPREDAPDFVGMGLDMMKLRKLQALPIATAEAGMAEVEQAILKWLRAKQPEDEGPRLGLALHALGWIDTPVDPLPLQAALLARRLGGWYDLDSQTLLTVSRQDSSAEAPPDGPMAIAFGQLLREYGSTLFPEGAGLSTDQRLARMALLAGDAGLTRFLFGLQNPAAQARAELPAEDPDHPLNSVPAPHMLKELTLFPISRGFEFAQALHSAGDFPQLNAAYSRPPVNCAEIIEVERYLDNNAAPTPRVDWPHAEIDGAKAFWDDSLGRYVCFTALRTYNSDEVAGGAAKAWMADRLLVYPAAEGPRDHAAWQTLWLTPDGATTFFKAMRHVLLQRYDVRPVQDETNVFSLAAKDRSVHLLRNQGGAGVLLIDAATEKFATALRAAGMGANP